MVVDLVDTEKDDNDFVDDILRDLGEACEWKLQCNNGSQRTITDLRKVRHRYRQVNVWDQECLLSDFDVPPSRELFWTPPLVLPRRDDLSTVVARFCPADHPRREWVLLPTADRQVETELWHNDIIRRIANAPEDEASVLMPACSWCGTPTGIYCYGFKSFRSSPGLGLREPIQYVCGRPVCSACEKWTDSCVKCSFWVGIAKASQPQEAQA